MFCDEAAELLRSCNEMQSQQYESDGHRAPVISTYKRCRGPAWPTGGVLSQLRVTRFMNGPLQLRIC